MSLEFVELDRIEVIPGGLAGLLSKLENEPTASEAAAAVVLPTDRTGSFLLVSRSELDDLHGRVQSREDVRPVLARLFPALTTSPDQKPGHPAVTVKGGEVLGAWVDVAESPGSMTPAEPAEPSAPSPPRRRRAWPRQTPPSSSERSIPSMPSRERSIPSRERSIPFPERSIPGEAAVALGEPTIRRTPHMDAPDEISTVPGTAFSVVVQTDSAPLRPYEEGTEVVIRAPEDVTEVIVGVVLFVSEHFAIDGEPYQPLTIRREDDESQPLIFTLRVTDTQSERKAGIQAVFLYHGRPCGQVGREWDWGPKSPTARPTTSASSAPATIGLHVGVREPHLTVIVTAPVNDGMHFQCLVQTPLLEEYQKPRVADFGLPMNARDYVTGILAKLIDEETQTPAKRQQALTEAGYKLFDAAPPLFREVLWSLIDSNRLPSTIYIASVEPTLPWELMIPSRPPDKQPSTLRPLGVEFAIGRWTRVDTQSPPQLMPLRNALIVAPDYEDESRKLNTDSEVKFVEKRLRGTRIKPATAEHLQSYVAQHPASILHFACHGASDVEDDDAVYLECDDVLRSIEVRISPQFQGLCARHAPLIFINACETGQMVPSLGGLAGFPYAFAMIGARAVIAPLWPVDDQLAHEVAREIYETALEPDAPALAEIIRGMRERAYASPNSDTYAAYCFYGDPLARLQLVEE